MGNILTGNHRFFHWFDGVFRKSIEPSIPAFQPRLMVLRLMLQFIKRGSDDHDAELEAGAVRDRDRAAGRYENRCARWWVSLSFFVQISLIYIIILHIISILYIYIICIHNFWFPPLILGWHADRITACFEGPKAPAADRIAVCTRFVMWICEVHDGSTWGWVKTYEITIFWGMTIQKNQLWLWPIG